MKNLYALLLAASMTILAAQDKPSPFSNTSEKSPSTLSEQPEDTSVQATPAEPVVKDATRSSRPGDPFAPELRTAKTLEVQWLALQDNLDETLEESPCGGRSALDAARGAAFQAFAARTVYYQRHLAAEQRTRREADQRGADRMPDRYEFETTLAAARREYADAQRRRKELDAALTGSRIGASADSLNRLDAIIAKSVEEIKSVEAALKAFDEGQAFLGQRRALARTRESQANDSLALVKAESMLWKAVYDSKGFRMDLRCHQLLPDIEPYKSPMKSFEGGVR